MAFAKVPKRVALQLLPLIVDDEQHRLRVRNPLHLQVLPFLPSLLRLLQVGRELGKLVQTSAAAALNATARRSNLGRAEVRKRSVGFRSVYAAVRAERTASGATPHGSIHTQHEHTHLRAGRKNLAATLLLAAALVHRLRIAASVECRSARGREQQHNQHVRQLKITNLNLINFPITV